MNLFVTGTDTEIGKTLVSAALLHALRRQGLQALGMKPVAAGAFWQNGAWHNEDVDQLIAASSQTLPIEQVCPFLLRQPAAPHIVAALEQTAIHPAGILTAYRHLTTLADAVVVEGVGGFRVPLTADFDTADLAQQLALPVILVVGLRLGCINHALLTAEAIQARGLHLAGWVANTIDPQMCHAQANVDAIASRLAAPLLGQIPYLADPSPATLLPPSHGISATIAANHLDLAPLRLAAHAAPCIP